MVGNYRGFVVSHVELTWTPNMEMDGSVLASDGAGDVSAWGTVGLHINTAAVTPPSLQFTATTTQRSTRTQRQNTAERKRSMQNTIARNSAPTHTLSDPAMAFLLVEGVVAN